MFHRKDAYGVLWREVPQEKTITSLFSQKELKIKFCPKCKRFHPISNFYLESKEKRKYPDQLRNMCVVCWDIFQGRLSNFEEIEEGIDVFGNPYVHLNEKKTFSRKVEVAPDLTIDMFTSSEE